MIYMNNILQDKMNLKYLTDGYVPKKILCRSKQIKEINKTFEQFMKFSSGKNLLIQGVTGSGKTATMKYLIKENQNLVCYASGIITPTSTTILQSLFDIKAKTIPRILTTAISQLQENPKILIIDEIHKIKDFKDLLQYLNGIYRETSIPIIIMTNVRRFLSKVEEDIQKTMFFERVEFPAYNAIELRKILDDRLKLSNVEIEEGIKNYICALGGKIGSARVVLSIVYKCFIENNFSKEFIQEIYNRIEEDDLREFIGGISPNEKKVLKMIIEGMDKKRFIKSTELKPEIGLGRSRISQIITGLENYGIIKTTTRNMGRKGGIYRIISIIDDDTFRILDELLY